MVNLSVKTQARIRLNGRTSGAFFWLFLQLILSVGLGTAAYYVYAAFRRTGADILGVCAQCALLLVSFWLVWALRQGRTAWHARLAAGGDPNWIQIVYWLRHARSLRSAALDVVIAFRKRICTLVLSAPAITAAFAAWYGYRSRAASARCCIVVFCGAALCGTAALLFSAVLAQRYCMAQFLLARNPRLTVRETIRQSKAYMDGRCLSMLCFRLSFLPWFITCTLILPAVYVMPYYSQCCACRMERILSASAAAQRRSECTQARK